MSETAGSRGKRKVISNTDDISINTPLKYRLVENSEYSRKCRSL